MAKAVKTTAMPADPKGMDDWQCQQDAKALSEIMGDPARRKAVMPHLKKHLAGAEAALSMMGGKKAPRPKPDKAMDYEA